MSPWVVDNIFRTIIIATSWQINALGRSTPSVQSWQCLPVSLLLPLQTSGWFQHATKASRRLQEELPTTLVSKPHPGLQGERRRISPRIQMCHSHSITSSLTQMSCVAEYWNHQLQQQLGGWFGVLCCVPYLLAITHPIQQSQPSRQGKKEHTHSTRNCRVTWWLETVLRPKGEKVQSL